MMRWIPAGLAAAFVLGFTVFGGQAQPAMALSEPAPVSMAAVEYVRFEGAGFSLELPASFAQTETQNGTYHFVDAADGVDCTIYSYPVTDGFSIEAATDALPFLYGDVTEQSETRMVKIGNGGDRDGLMALVAVDEGRVVEVTFSFAFDQLVACQNAFAQVDKSLQMS